MTTTPDAAIKAAVKQAFDAIDAAFPDCAVTSHPDGQGGLWVELTGVPFGDPYVQGDSFIVFLLPFTLPGADIYPMFVRPDLARRDGAALGEGFAATELSWPAEPSPRQVLQISRRTRGNLFAAQTAPQKVTKVLDWVMSR